MKTEQERTELIKKINEILIHAYDSTLNETYARLLKIEDEEDEADLRAYEKAKVDDEDDELIPLEDIEKELEQEIANQKQKDVACL